jgi:RNA polymerase sigma factor (TIGR02999 family)
MKRAAKRSGAARSTATDRILVEWEANALDLVALDDALCELAAMDARKARVIELRFFAGLTAQQAADLLETPLRTVNRDWAAARAWLYARLQDR